VDIIIEKVATEAKRS